MSFFFVNGASEQGPTCDERKARYSLHVERSGILCHPVRETLVSDTV